MAVLDDKLAKARAKYLRYIRLRGDCKNELGARWKEMDEKLLVAEEEYHRLGDKVRIRDAKKAAKKQPKKVVSKKTTSKSCKKTVAKNKDTKYVVAGNGNGKTIWDL